MAAILKKKRLPGRVLSLPVDDCPIERLRFKIYTTASPSDGPAGLIGTTTIRESAASQQPSDRLIATIEAPTLSFAHGDDFFINRPCDHSNFKGQTATEGHRSKKGHRSKTEGASFTLIVLRAHEALDAALKGEHNLSLIWADPSLHAIQHVQLRSPEPIRFRPEARRCQVSQI
jgi:hypothetical protein